MATPPTQQSTTNEHGYTTTHTTIHNTGTWLHHHNTTIHKTGTWLHHHNTTIHKTGTWLHPTHYTPQHKNLATPHTLQSTTQEHDYTTPTQQSTTAVGENTTLSVFRIRDCTDPELHRYGSASAWIHITEDYLDPDQ